MTGTPSDSLQSPTGSLPSPTDSFPSPAGGQTLFALVPAAYLLLLRAVRPHGPAGAAVSVRTEAGDGVARGTLPPALADLPGAEGTEVLLQLRQHTGYMDGYWACGVAGHVEAGESVLATAVREAREEAGIVVAPADLVPLTAMHRSNAPGGPALEQRVDFFLAARTWAGEPTVTEPERNAGLRWFRLDRLPEKVPPHERAVLDALASWLDDAAPLPPILTFGFAGEQIERYEAARPHGPAH